MATKDPKLQKTKSKGFQQYLAQLDELLKRNTGQGVFTGEDVAPGFIVREGRRVRNPYGFDIGQEVPGLAPYQRQEQPTAFNQLTTVPQQQESVGQGFGQGLPAQGSQGDSQIAPIGQPQIGRDTESLEQAYQQTGRVYGIQQLQDGGVLYNDGTVRYQDGTIRDAGSNTGATAISSQADGSVLYSDGSVRRPQTFDELDQMTKAPEGLMSVAGDRERILYDDGQVRYGDYLYEQGEGRQFSPGMAGLSESIFGRPNQTVTQEYGRYNPGVGYYQNRHAGVDYRVKDLPGAGAGGVGAPASFQLDADVFATGTNKAYGNYVVLDINGHKLQFSHLDSINVQPGQQLKAGETFGAYGTSGNSGGAHLDLQYFTPETKFDPNTDFISQIRWGTDQAPQNPVKFAEAVLSQPQSFANRIPGAAPGTIVPQEELSQALLQTIAATKQRTEQRTGQQTGQIGTESITPEEYTPVAQRVKEESSQAVQRTLSNPFTQAVATGIEKVNPTGDLGIGATEALRGDIPGAFKEQTQTAEKLGTKLGAPELLIGELGRGEATPGQVAKQTGQVLGTGIEKANLTGDFDTGVSELLKGDFKGAKENFLDATSRVGSRLSALPGQISSAIVPQAQAYTPDSQKASGKESLGDNLRGIKNTFINEFNQQKDRGETALSQAGQGIESLKDSLVKGVSGLGELGNVFRRPTGADIDTERVVGNEPAPGTSLLPGSTQQGQKNDVRDPFFKEGLDKVFGQYLNAKDTGGALSLDLFKPDFFQDISRIGTVFGGTQYEKPATDKYVQYEIKREEDRIRREIEDQKRKAEDMKRKPGEAIAEWMKRTGQQSTIDSIISGGGHVKDQVTLSPTQTQKLRDEAAKKSSDMARKPGEALEEWMKRTGQQSTLDQIRSVSYQDAVKSDRSTGSGVQGYVDNRGRTVAAGPNQRISFDSSGSPQRVDAPQSFTGANGRTYEYNANVIPTKTPSAQLNYGSRSTDIGRINPFRNIATGISNLFKSLF